MIGNNRLVTGLLGLLLFAGCSSDNPGIGPTDTKLSVAEVDKSFFAQINGCAGALASSPFWSGYEYGKVPQYVIYVSGSRPNRAFIINPATTVSGAVKVGDADRNGLDVWQYNAKMQAGYDILFGANGNRAYDFDFEIDGKKYYVMVYTDKSVASPYESIDLSVHENFHAYQNSWTQIDSWNQDVPNFPITQELLEYQMLVGEIFRDMPNSTSDKAEMRKMLEQYVAIRSREVEIDPSAGKLIENFELVQEQTEGSAKYIEVMTHRSHFKNNKPIADYGLMELGPITRAEAQDLIAQTVTYNTGGTALYIMNQLGVDITQIRQGKTPYQLASAFLNMSESDRTAALAAAKQHSKWTAIKAEAAKWLGLK